MAHPFVEAEKQQTRSNWRQRLRALSSKFMRRQTVRQRIVKSPPRIARNVLASIVQKLSFEPLEPRLLLNADIFAFTSLNESYSLTILEAMASGLPIVTTSCQGIDEQVRFGVNALHFDFSDDGGLAEKLRYLLDHRDVSLKMGSNSKMMWQYMGAYDRMLSAHQRSIQSAWQQGSRPFSSHDI